MAIKFTRNAADRNDFGNRLIDRLHDTYEVDPEKGEKFSTTSNHPAGARSNLIVHGALSRAERISAGLNLGAQLPPFPEGQDVFAGATSYDPATKWSNPLTSKDLFGYTTKDTKTSQQEFHQTSFADAFSEIQKRTSGQGKWGTPVWDEKRGVLNVQFTPSRSNETDENGKKKLPSPVDIGFRHVEGQNVWLYGSSGSRMNLMQSTFDGDTFRSATENLFNTLVAKPTQKGLSKSNTFPVIGTSVDVLFERTSSLVSQSQVINFPIAATEDDEQRGLFENNLYKIRQSESAQAYFGNTDTWSNRVFYYTDNSGMVRPPQFDSNAPVAKDARRSYRPNMHAEWMGFAGTSPEPGVVGGAFADSPPRSGSIARNVYIRNQLFFSEGGGLVPTEIDKHGAPIGRPAVHWTETPLDANSDLAEAFYNTTVRGDQAGKPWDIRRSFGNPDIPMPEGYVHAPGLNVKELTNLNYFQGARAAGVLQGVYEQFGSPFALFGTVGDASTSERKDISSSKIQGQPFSNTSPLARQLESQLGYMPDLIAPVPAKKKRIISFAVDAWMNQQQGRDEFINELVEFGSQHMGMTEDEAKAIYGYTVRKDKTRTGQTYTTFARSIEEDVSKRAMQWLRGQRQPLNLRGVHLMSDRVDIGFERLIYKDSPLTEERIKREKIAFSDVKAADTGGVLDSMQIVGWDIKRTSYKDPKTGKIVKSAPDLTYDVDTSMIVMETPMKMHFMTATPESRISGREMDMLAGGAPNLVSQVEKNYSKRALRLQAQYDAAMYNRTGGEALVSDREFPDLQETITKMVTTDPRFAKLAEGKTPESAYRAYITNVQMEAFMSSVRPTRKQLATYKETYGKPGMAMGAYKRAVQQSVGAEEGLLATEFWQRIRKDLGKDFDTFSATVEDQTYAFGSMHELMNKHSREPDDSAMLHLFRAFQVGGIGFDPSSGVIAESKEAKLLPITDMGERNELVTAAIRQDEDVSQEKYVERMFTAVVPSLGGPAMSGPVPEGIGVAHGGDLIRLIRAQTHLSKEDRNALIANLRETGTLDAAAIGRMQVFDKEAFAPGLTLMSYRTARKLYPALRDYPPARGNILTSETVAQGQSKDDDTDLQQVPAIFGASNAELRGAYSELEHARTAGKERESTRKKLFDNFGTFDEMLADPIGSVDKNLADALTTRKERTEQMAEKVYSGGIMGKSFTTLNEILQYMSPSNGEIQALGQRHFSTVVYQNSMDMAATRDASTKLILEMISRGQLTEPDEQGKQKVQLPPLPNEPGQKYRNKPRLYSFESVAERAASMERYYAGSTDEHLEENLKHLSEKFGDIDFGGSLGHILIGPDSEISHADVSDKIRNRTLTGSDIGGADWLFSNTPLSRLLMAAFSVNAASNQARKGNPFVIPGSPDAALLMARKARKGTMPINLARALAEDDAAASRFGSLGGAYARKAAEAIARNPGPGVRGAPKPVEDFDAEPDDYIVDYDMSDNLPEPPPGYKKGGYTGWGDKNEPAGTVHKGEYVLTQKEVDAIRHGAGEHVLDKVEDDLAHPIFGRKESFASGGAPFDPHISAPGMWGKHPPTTSRLAYRASETYNGTKFTTRDPDGIYGVRSGSHIDVNRGRTLDDWLRDALHDDWMQAVSQDPKLTWGEFKAEARMPTGWRVSVPFEGANVAVSADTMTVGEFEKLNQRWQSADMMGAAEQENIYARDLAEGSNLYLNLGSATRQESIETLRTNQFQQGKLYSDPKTGDILYGGLAGARNMEGARLSPLDRALVVQSLLGKYTAEEIAANEELTSWQEESRSTLNAFQQSVHTARQSGLRGGIDAAKHVTPRLDSSGHVMVDPNTGEVLGEYGSKMGQVGAAGTAARQTGNALRDQDFAQTRARRRRRSQSRGIRAAKDLDSVLRAYGSGTDLVTRTEELVARGDALTVDEANELDRNMDLVGRMQQDAEAIYGASYTSRQAQRGAHSVAARSGVVDEEAGTVQDRVAALTGNRRNISRVSKQGRANRAAEDRANVAASGLDEDSLAMSVRGLDEFNKQVGTLAALMPKLNDGHKVYLQQSETALKLYDRAKRELGVLGAATSLTPEQQNRKAELAQSVGVFEAMNTPAQIQGMRDEIARRHGRDAFADKWGDMDKDVKNNALIELLAGAGSRTGKSRLENEKALGAFDEGIDILGGINLNSDRAIGAYGKFLRGFNSMSTASNIWAMRSVQSMIMRPFSELSQGYEVTSGREARNLITGGIIDPATLQASPYGQRLQRQNVIARLQYGMGQSVYDAYGWGANLLNAGGNADSGVLGDVAAVGAPAIGAGLIAGTAAKALFGTAMIPGIGIPLAAAVAGGSILAGAGSLVLNQSRDFRNYTNGADLFEQIGGGLQAIGGLLGDPTAQRRFEQDASAETLTNAIQSLQSVGGYNRSSFYSSFGVSRFGYAMEDMPILEFEAWKKGYAGDLALLGENLPGASEIYSTFTSRGLDPSDPALMSQVGEFIAAGFSVPELATQAMRGSTPTSANVLGSTYTRFSNEYADARRRHLAPDVATLQAQFLTQGYNELSTQQEGLGPVGRSFMPSAARFSDSFKADALAYGGGYAQQWGQQGVGFGISLLNRGERGMTGASALIDIYSGYKAAGDTLGMTAVMGTPDFAGISRGFGSGWSNRESDMIASSYSGRRQYGAGAGMQIAESLYGYVTPNVPGQGPATTFIQELDNLNKTSQMLADSNIDLSRSFDAWVESQGKTLTATNAQGLWEQYDKLYNITGAGGPNSRFFEDYPVEGAQGAYNQSFRYFGLGLSNIKRLGQYGDQFQDQAAQQALLSGIQSIGGAAGGYGTSTRLKAESTLSTGIDQLASGQLSPFEFVRRMQQGAYAADVGGMNEFFDGGLSSGGFIDRITNLPKAEFNLVSGALGGNQRYQSMMAVGSGYNAMTSIVSNPAAPQDTWGRQRYQYGWDPGTIVGYTGGRIPQRVGDDRSYLETLHQSFLGKGMDYLSGQSVAQVMQQFPGGIQEMQFQIGEIQYQAQAAQYAYSTLGRNIGVQLQAGGYRPQLDPQSGFMMGGSNAGAARLFSRAGYTFMPGDGRTYWQLEDDAVRQQRERQSFGLMQQGQNLALSWEQFELSGRQFNEREAMSYRRLNLSDQQFQQGFALQKQRFDWNTAYQEQSMQIGRRHEITQIGWQGEDLAYNRNMMEVQFGFQMRDANRNIRYARGRERIDAMRQRDDATVLYSMQAGQADRQETRHKTQAQWAEEQFKREEENFKKTIAFQKEEMKLTEKHHIENLRYSQDELKLQRKHFEESRELEKKRLGMGQAAFERELAWMEETWKREDQQRLLDRQAYLVQTAIAQKAADASMGAATRIHELQKKIDFFREAAMKGNDTIQMLNTTMNDNWIKAMERGTQAAKDFAIAFNAIDWPTILAGSGGVMTGGFIGADGVIPQMAAGGAPGYTGNGLRQESAGLHELHRGEYVVPQNGTLVMRGENPQTLAVLIEIRNELRELRRMGPGRVNANIYTNRPSVGTAELLEQAYGTRR